MTSLATLTMLLPSHASTAQQHLHIVLVDVRYSLRCIPACCVLRMYDPFSLLVPIDQLNYQCAWT